MTCLPGSLIAEFLDFAPCGFHRFGSLSISYIACAPPHHTDQQAMRAVCIPLPLILLLRKVSAAVSSISAGSGFAVFLAVCLSFPVSTSTGSAGGFSYLSHVSRTSSDETVIADISGVSLTMSSAYISADSISLHGGAHLSGHFGWEARHCDSSLLTAQWSCVSNEYF